MPYFQRGWTIADSPASSDRLHAQLWVPKAKPIIAQVRRVLVEAPGGWHLVMTSTRLNNRVFGASSLPDGIATDSSYAGSQAELWDERRSYVPAAMMGSFLGDEDIHFAPGEFLVRGNMADPTELGAGLTVRSESHVGLRVTFVWEELPV